MARTSNDTGMNAQDPPLRNVTRTRFRQIEEPVPTSSRDPLEISVAVKTDWAQGFPSFYDLVKTEDVSVLVLSAKDSCSIPMERRTLRYMFDIRAPS